MAKIKTIKKSSRTFSPGSKRFIGTILTVAAVVIAGSTFAFSNRHQTTIKPEIDVNQNKLQLEVTTNANVNTWQWGHISPDDNEHTACNQQFRFSDYTNTQTLNINLQNNNVPVPDGSGYCLKVTTSDNQNVYYKYTVLDVSDQIIISQKNSTLKAKAGVAVANWQWRKIWTDFTCDDSTDDAVFNQTSSSQVVTIHLRPNHSGFFYCFKMTATDNLVYYFKYQVEPLDAIRIYQQDLTLAVESDLVADWRWRHNRTNFDCNDQVDFNTSQTQTNQIVINLSIDHSDYVYCFELADRGQVYYRKYHIKPLQIVKVDQINLSLNVSSLVPVKKWRILNQSTDFNCDNYTNFQTERLDSQLQIQMPANHSNYNYCFELTTNKNQVIYHKYRVNPIPIVSAHLVGSNLVLESSQSVRGWQYFFSPQHSSQPIVCGPQIPDSDYLVRSTETKLVLGLDKQSVGRTYCFKLTLANKTVYHQELIRPMIVVKPQLIQSEQVINVSALGDVHRWDLANFKTVNKPCDSDTPLKHFEGNSTTPATSDNLLIKPKNNDQFFCFRLTTTDNQVVHYKYRRP